MNNKQWQWMTKLLLTLWIHIHNFWLARNDDRHGSTNKAKSQASQQQAQGTIQALYLLEDLVLSEDRDLFYNSIKAHLQQPLWELNAWITTHQGLIAYSVLVAKLATQANTKPITEHFTMLKCRQCGGLPNPDVLPKPTHYRNTKLTQYIIVT
jgi:hypothetical protein